MVESRGSMPCSLKMTRRFNKGSSFIGCFASSLLEDRVISVVDEPGAHGLGVFDVGEGADLHAKQLVGGRIASHEGGVLFLFEGVDQGLGVVLFAVRGDLDEVKIGTG